MPHAEKGMAVGLFGGSFNPPHAGHALVAEIALRRLALDQLWWIVTPGNPLKNASELAPLAERIRLSEDIAGGSAHQGDRLRGRPQSPLHRRHAGAGQGAQSGRPLRLDHGRRQSARLPPLAALAPDRADLPDRRHRPAGLDASFLSSVVAKTFDYARVDEGDAPILARMRAPAWTFIHGPRSSLSSSAIQARR